MKKGRHDIKRDCAACGKPAQAVMKHKEGDCLTVCASCAELLASELMMDAHGSYVRAWGLAAS